MLLSIDRLISKYGRGIHIILLLLPLFVSNSNFIYLPLIAYNLGVFALRPKRCAKALVSNKGTVVFLVVCLASSLLRLEVVDVFKILLVSFNAAVMFHYPQQEPCNTLPVILILILTWVFPAFNELGYFVSIYKHPNSIGTSIILAFYLVSVLNKPIRFRLFLFSLVVLTAFLTKSRGVFVFGFLYVLCVLGFYLLNERIKLFQRRVCSLMILGLISVSYFVLLHNEPKIRGVLHSFGTFNAENRPKPILGLSKRDRHYRKSIEMFKERPLVGWGSETTKSVFHDPYYNNVQSPHNTYLKILVEYGGLALVAFLFLLGYFCFSLESSTCMAFFVAYNVRMLFEAGMPFGYSLSSALIIFPILQHLENNKEKC